VVVLEVVTYLILVGGPNTALGTLFMVLLVVMMEAFSDFALAPFAVHVSLRAGKVKLQRLCGYELSPTWIAIVWAWVPGVGSVVASAHPRRRNEVDIYMFVFFEIAREGVGDLLDMEEMHRL